MKNEEIFNRILIAAIKDGCLDHTDGVTPESSFSTEDLNIKSLDFMSFMCSIETEFKIRIFDDEMWELKNIQDLITLVSNKEIYDKLFDISISSGFLEKKESDIKPSDSIRETFGLESLADVVIMWEKIEKEFNISISKEEIIRMKTNEELLVLLGDKIN